MGKPQHVEDDLMMTIASDDELSVVEESSDDETEQDAALKDAIISKKQEKAEERAAKKQNQIAEDFKFDETDGYRGSTGSSWDFTNAISRIVHMEERGVVTKRTTVQTKIDNFKKEKLKAKEEKKARKLAAEKKKEKALKKEQATEKEDEDMSGDSENENDDGEGDNDNDAEDESSSSEEEEEEEIQHYEQEDDGDEDQVAEEEARLMAALKDGKNGKADKDQEIDELERAKAAEFFESDPFAAEEFAKTSFATFADLKLSRPLMRAITELGFEKPTPIQQRAIPIAMTGKDICASAQTGSGKTAAFLLPILERLQFRSRRVAATRVMIICPVRELATQCQSMLEQLARFTDITSALAVGGLPLKPQEVELRNRPDVVICTPGRMIDHLRNSKSVHMDELEILVLDEADRLLELGFTEEVQELVRMCPVARQTMLFSATLSTKVDKLIELSMKRPVRISTDPLFDMAKHLVQEFVRIRPQRESDREAILLALCTRTFKTNTIVFMETKVHAHRMMIIFGLAGLKAAELHGNLTQKERLEALQNFRDSNVDILLCTDVAARGIDVKGVHAVINYEMPKDITTYVHRVGRTARAGRNGRAVTLTSERRRLLMKEVSRHCHGFVKSRAVPDPVIAQWKARIESMESDIKLIMREEVLEKRMREVERDADRASNMLKYEDEIRSRPARTWFQSEKEKKNVMERAEDDRQSKLTAAEEAANGGGETKTRAQMLKQMNHKKRRRFEIREREQQMLDDARRAEEEAGGEEGAATKKGAKKVFGSVHVAASAKHSKKEKALEARAREEESISEIHERKRLKREKDRSLKSSHKEPSSSGGKSGRNGGGAFDVDLSARDYKPIYETTKRRDAKKSGADTESFDFKEKITNFKKHAKKGTSKFKSQSKFRRR